MDNRPHLSIPLNNVTTSSTKFNGGPPTYPRESFYEHGISLENNLKRVVEEQTQEDVTDRYFIEVQVASTEKLRDRFTDLQNKVNIGLSDIKNQSVGYGYIKKEDIGILREKILEYANSQDHSGKSLYSFIEEFKNINPSEKIDPELRRKMVTGDQNGRVSIIIESFSGIPEQLREGDLEGLIEEFIKLRGNGRLINSYIDSSDSLIIKIETETKYLDEIAKNFSSIKTMELSKKLSTSKVEIRPEEKTTSRIAEMQGNAKVCIFDTGVDESNDFLSEYILRHEDAVVCHNYDTSHGSFVASRVIFRDNIEEQIESGILIPKARVLDVRVFGEDGHGIEISPDERDLVYAIRETVNRNHEHIKVYNLSLGMINEDGSTTLDENKVSRLAAELDSLAKRYNILFVVAAGNINDHDLYRNLNHYGGYPMHFSPEGSRISTPGEALNALTVGSVSNRYTEGALAGVGLPSPFSRRGPGLINTRKPELAADGGNSSMDSSTIQEVEAMALVNNNPNQVIYDKGTSFAAPIVASYASELFDLYPEISNNLVRAMLIHFAEVRNSVDFEDIHNHVGFGVPNLEECYNSLIHKASFIHEGSLEQKQYYKIPFWVPSILTSNQNRSGRKKLKVKITVVWDPETDRRKREDYSLVHINVNLYKNFNGEQQVQTGMGNLLDRSFKNTYYPVVHIEKDFERNIEGGSWYIQLRMSQRWEISEDYEQSFAVIISVEDPNEEIEVYQEVINEVGVRFPVVNRV